MDSGNVLSKEVWKKKKSNGEVNWTDKNLAKV